MDSVAEDEAFKELVALMRRQPAPLALIGAGVSRASGYPDWRELLAKLSDKARKHASPKYLSYLESLADPAWQAEEYRRLLGEHAFKSTVAALFAPRSGSNPLLDLIVKLGFRHILTTNYDDCIERAFERAGMDGLQVIEWSEEANMRRFFLDLSRSNAPPYLVHLHGRYYSPAEVILTETSYVMRYVRSEDAQRKLFALFITQPVVLIGFSVNDPDLNSLMREVNARLGVGPPQHFALTGYELDEQRLLSKRRLEGKFGIQPVFYRVTRKDGSEDHSELRELLERLYARLHNREYAAEEPVSGDITLEPLSSVDPLDQQKGQWGGRAEANSRRLRVEFVKEYEEKWCDLDLVVESTDPSSPLSGEVIFHLHHTFPDHRRSVSADGDGARLHIGAYGAFTVGAEADGGRTILELDLAQETKLPKWFRMR